jgi:Tfp pilus assembly protein PilF
MAAAEDEYLQALLADPELPEAHYNLGNQRFRAGRLSEAAILFERACALRPRFPEALLNLGNIQRVQSDLDAAESTYRRVLEIRPDFAEAHVNLGNVHRARNELPRAIVAYERALSLQPNLSEAHLNLALAHLAAGEWRRAWAGTEHRWTLKHAPPLRRFRAEHWTGAQPLAGRSILLHAEQGLGDTIQFVRYVRWVAARGARVFLEVQPALRQLLDGFPDTATVLSRGEPVPDCDYECPLLSLPHAFNTDLTTIPVTQQYVAAPPAHMSKWIDWVATRPTRPRIGVKWSGNPSFPIGMNRSIPEPVFAQLLAGFPGANFVCLEKEALDPAGPARRHCPGLAAPQTGLADLADTAALIAQLDLVITIDTCIAHLAGAMGRPVWILLPFAADWRWLLNRSDSVWYPSMRLFRQSRAGDWPGVLNIVRLALADHFQKQVAA